MTTEQTDAAEVEALCTALLSARWHHGGCTTQSNMQRKIIAVSLLDSDWLRDLLAAREAAARAEALREAADAAVPMFNMHPANRTNTVADWLRDRADSIARTDGAGS